MNDSYKILMEMRSAGLIASAQPVSAFSRFNHPYAALRLPA
jgi:hypothetical protein